MTIYVPLGQLMDFSILSFFPGYSSQMPSIIPRRLYVVLPVQVCNAPVFLGVGNPKSKTTPHVLPRL